MVRSPARRSSRGSSSLATLIPALLAGATLFAQEPNEPPEEPDRAAAESPDPTPETAAPEDEDALEGPPPPPSEEAAPAEDAPPPPRRRLETIVVTATSLEEEDFYVPYVVDSLEGEVLTSRKAFRTFPEALREVPGVMIQKTSHGQGSPFIRGFTGFRTLLLLDGIRLNNAVFRDGPNQYWNTVDPLTIDRLEVVKGPSSVLYGSDAIGGTVAAFTRSRAPFPPGAETEGFDWSRRIYYRFASAEDSHVARGEVSGAYGSRLGLLGGVSYKDFGDLAAGRGTGVQPNTAYEELNGDLKGILRLAPDLDLVAAFQRVGQDDVPRTHSTVFSKPFQGTVAGSDLRRDFDQTRTLGYTQLHWKPEEVAWLNRLSASFSFQLQEEEEMRVRSNMRLRRQGFDDATYGMWLRLESPSPVVGVLSYGVEYYRDEVDSFFREFETDGSLREVRPRGPVADDASYDLVGVYLQDSFRPLERWEVILGGRFNYARADADVVDPDPATAPDIGPIEEDFSAVVGSARVLFEATEEWNLFGGVSQGFRAPNLADLTRFDVSRSGEVETPAPGLEPEDFVTFEGGAKVLFEDLGLEGYGAYYYTLVEDLIVRFPTGNTIDGDPEVTKDNVGDGFVHGVELSLAWNFHSDFTLFGTATWLEGEVETFDGGSLESEPLSRLQPAMGLFGVRWDPPEGYWVEALVTIVDNQDRLSPRDIGDVQRIPPGGTPGYTVYTLRGGLEVTDGLNVFAAIENITDKNYRVHGSGQNEAGTNVILGADWTF